VSRQRGQWAQGLPGELSYKRVSNVVDKDNKAYVPVSDARSKVITVRNHTSTLLIQSARHSMEPLPSTALISSSLIAWLQDILKHGRTL
jgi:hypothetical protein